MEQPSCMHSWTYIMQYNYIVKYNYIYYIILYYIILYYIILYYIIYIWCTEHTKHILPTAVVGWFPIWSIDMVIHTVVLSDDQILVSLEIMFFPYQISAWIAGPIVPKIVSVTAWCLEGDRLTGRLMLFVWLHSLTSKISNKNAWIKKQWKLGCNPQLLVLATPV